MTTIKKKSKKDDDLFAASSADKMADSNEAEEKQVNEDGDEVRVRIEDKIIHHFKMNSEKMDHLMSLHQWKFMKGGDDKEDPKDINIEDIDVSELRKYNLTEERPETVNEENGEPAEEKECRIF